MEGDLEPRGSGPRVVRVRSADELRVAFRAALLAPDVRLARELIDEAASSGIAPGPLYVEVVRPALAALAETPQGARERLSSSLGAAVLASLGSQLPVASADRAGRAALVAGTSAGIDEIDRDVITDFLEADGWTVEACSADDEAKPVVAVARARAVELAVAVASGPEAALRLAPLCTGLRRLADPPVLVLCDFSGRTEPGVAATSLGADALACDPGELVAHAARRLPGPGMRRWGVGIRRDGDALVLAPTGRLDATSVERLIDVAASRIGTFQRLVLDLRELAELEAGGVQALAVWTSTGAWRGVDVDLAADARAAQAFAAAGAESLIRDSGSALRPS